jgi:hypothetical protein
MMCEILVYERVERRSTFFRGSDPGVANLWVRLRVGGQKPLPRRLPSLRVAVEEESQNRRDPRQGRLSSSSRQIGLVERRVLSRFGRRVQDLTESLQKNRETSSQRYGAISGVSRNVAVGIEAQKEGGATLRRRDVEHTRALAEFGSVGVLVFVDLQNDRVRSAIPVEVWSLTIAEPSQSPSSSVVARPALVWSQKRLQELSNLALLREAHLRPPSTVTTETSRTEGPEKIARDAAALDEIDVVLTSMKFAAAGTKRSVYGRVAASLDLAPTPGVAHLSLSLVLRAEGDRKTRQTKLGPRVTCHFLADLVHHVDHALSLVKHAEAAASHMRLRKSRSNGAARILTRVVGDVDHTLQSVASAEPTTLLVRIREGR